MIIALGAWLLVSCAPSVSVTVVSEAAARLDSLVLVGTIGPRRLRDLAPSESLRVSIEIPGEDMLQLRGRLAGRALPRPFGTYVEPGAQVRIAVLPDGSQRITTRPPGDAR